MLVKETEDRAGLSPAGRVLMKVARAAHDVGGDFERIQILKATETQYAYRIFVTGGLDYEGGIVTLDH